MLLFLITMNLILNLITIIFGVYKNETFKDNVLYVLLLILSISLCGATIQMI